MATSLATRIREPLGLPHGSVRGTIALIATATYAYLLLYGKPVQAVLINSVVVVIAFYFGSRAAMGAATPVTTPGQTPSVGVPSTRRRTAFVRGILLLGFAGLAAWFLRTSLSLDAIPKELQAVLEVLVGYVSGLVISWLVHRRAHESIVRKRLATIARDVIAVGSLGLTAYTCFALATGQTKIFSGHEGDVLSLVVTFYFGSRVIGR